MTETVFSLRTEAEILAILDDQRLLQHPGLSEFCLKLARGFVGTRYTPQTFAMDLLTPIAGAIEDGTFTPEKGHQTFMTFVAAMTPDELTQQLVLNAYYAILTGHNSPNQLPTK